MKKWEARDALAAGVFAAIHCALMVACGQAERLPMLYVFLPVLLPLVMAIFFMLFLTKGKSLGRIALMGALGGGLTALFGHTLLPVVAGVVGGLTADLICMAGRYQSRKFSVLGCGVFSLWMAGAALPFRTMKESFEKAFGSGLGGEYAARTSGLFESIAWLFPFLALGAGIIGAFLGMALWKKQFRQAGIV